MIDYVVKEKPLSNHPSNVKAKMTLLKFLNQKSFGFTLYCIVRGWGHDVWIDPHSPFICDMCDEQATIHHPSQRILDLQQKFFQNGRLGSTEKNLASNKSSFKVGDG